MLKSLQKIVNMLGVWWVTTIGKKISHLLKHCLYVLCHAFYSLSLSLSHNFVGWEIESVGGMKGDYWFSLSFPFHPLPPEQQNMCTHKKSFYAALLDFMNYQRFYILTGLIYK